MAKVLPYTEITLEEHMIFIRDKQYDDLTPNDREEILSILIGYKNVEAIQNTAKIVCESRIRTTHYHYDNISIVKMEDEWFYVTYYIRTPIFIPYYYYFECDQIDGLIKCMLYLLGVRIKENKEKILKASDSANKLFFPHEVKKESMNHLKLFENFLSEEKLYTEIKVESVVDIFSGRGLDFSKNEFIDISTFITKNINLNNINLSERSGYNNSIIVKTGEIKGVTKIDIMKFPDEWYLIIYYMNYHKSRIKTVLNIASQIIDTGRIDHSLSRVDKCDTIDGVKQSLLNYKNNFAE